MSPWIAIVPLILFILMAALGMRIRLDLAEHHRNEETTELLRITVSMLVTFSAIVLGLLITSSKASFDNAFSAVHSYAASLLELDETLAEAGPMAAPIHQRLIEYTAVAIASTWTGQKPPAGNYPRPPAPTGSEIPNESVALGRVLRGIDHAIVELPAGTRAQLETQQSCISRMNEVNTQRWALINAAQVPFSTPFFLMLVFWLTIMFLCLGLSAPLNALSFLSVTVSGVSIASALFVIIDLNGFFDGFFVVSSAPMRDALAQMLQSN